LSNFGEKSKRGRNTPVARDCEDIQLTSVYPHYKATIQIENFTEAAISLGLKKFYSRGTIIAQLKNNLEGFLIIKKKHKLNHELGFYSDNWHKKRYTTSRLSDNQIAVTRGSSGLV